MSNPHIRWQQWPEKLTNKNLAYPSLNAWVRDLGYGPGFAHSRLNPGNDDIVKYGVHRLIQSMREVQQRTGHSR
jgi:hypothetical protein